MPIYVGDDPAFAHMPAIGGLAILLTGGPATDGYFLRSAMQVRASTLAFTPTLAVALTHRRLLRALRHAGAGHHAGPGL